MKRNIIQAIEAKHGEDHAKIIRSIAMKIADGKPVR
jgi:hypothetical protein